MNFGPGRFGQVHRPIPCTSDRNALRADRLLARLPAAALRRLALAGSEVSECMRILAKTGHNVVGEVLEGAGEFVEWRHYPESDAYDPQTHAQYYYHAHPQDTPRPFNEHGHFHLFLRKPGMPRGVGPAPNQSPVEGDGAALSHLIAISMNAYGMPERLFTANRWVTGDTWYDAADVIAMLECFDMDVVRPNWLVNRWLTAMARLFRPQIVALLRARDDAVKAWSSAHPGGDTFEDRRLEVISVCEIAIDQQLAAIAAARDALKMRRGPRGFALAPGHC